MRLRRLRVQDTIAARLAATVMLAVAVSCGMYWIFSNTAVIWASPDIANDGLLEQAGVLERVLSASPPELRPALAAAAGNDRYTVSWMPSLAAAHGRPNPGLRGAIRDRLQRLLPGIRTPPLMYKSSEPQRSRRPDPIFGTAEFGMAIALQDGSWVVFKVPRRSWGLDALDRTALILAFLLLSTAAVSMVAARSLVRPIEAFAAGARRFGSDPGAPAMAERGPRELRVAIRAFNAMQTQISRFVTDRTEMLAAISHDLRTPLTRVRLRGELIEDREQQARLFRDVAEMQAMIEAALALFRDETSEESSTDFDMSELMRVVVDDLLDQERDAVFEGDDHVVYHGRPLALKRGIANLAENACIYGGHATLGLEAAADALILSIRDTGPGIPDEMLEKVFAPFVRVERSRNRQTGGVGLGLSSARSIVRAHGGDVILCNDPAGGLVARVSLPLLTN